MSDDIISQTNRWFVHAGQQPAVPTPDPKQACFYIGLQLEELAEKLALVLGADSVAPLVEAATTFKVASPDLVFKVANALSDHPTLMLDADMDLIWVTLGSARAQGADTALAYGLVNEANWAKFPGGIVTKDANGKVVKPADWREPDLTPAVHELLKPTTNT